MFDVISTGKNTQWLSFPTLCSKYTHSHVSNEAGDFKVVPGKNYFAAFNKKFGFELLRTTNKDNQEIIQRAKKRQFDNLSCGAISKLCGSEIALGMTTGFIRIFSTQSGDYMPFKFKPDRIGNSVVDLDYSNTDEYLAAVYDSSDINLFGMKTTNKIDTFRFGGVPTLVRFHPVRKLALAIGTYEGGITMLDIQTKRKLFFDKNVHDAPVRDISMFDSSQDVFVSCSYDCSIRVFDLRKRAMVQQHKQAHPMSTVCVSSCGTFCVAGNLKGDVISYDFRSLKEPLDTRRVYDHPVVRVAFVPSETNSSLNMENSVNSTCFASSTPLYKSSQSSYSSSRSSNNVESFAKFIDVCHHINDAAADPTTPKHRDSWAELMPRQKVHDFSLDSVVDTTSRMSIGGDMHSTPQSRYSVGQTMSELTESDTQSKLSIPEIHVSKPSEEKERQVIEPKRRRLTEVVPLEGIEEESPIADKSHDPPQKKWLHTVNHKDFADGFAAFVKRINDENTMAEMGKQGFFHEDDKENHQNNQQKPVILSQKSITHTPNRNTLGMSALYGNSRMNRVSSFDEEFDVYLRGWEENVTAFMSAKVQELSSQVRILQGRYSVGNQYSVQ